MKINNNRFSELALIDRKASSWKQPFKHLTTLKTGDIVPIYAIDIMPGDNINMKTSKLFTRMTTPIFPVMDNAYLDIFYFYVPNRILYENFEEFLGAKKDGYGIQEEEFLLPNVYDISYNENDIGGYLGLPLGKTIQENDAINTMYFRAYVKIYNEYFRDENLIQPYEVKEIYESLDYNDSVDSLSEISKLQYGKGIAKASKLHDLFTSALPFTQKGPSVVFNFSEPLPLKDIGGSESINLVDASNWRNSKLRVVPNPDDDVPLYDKRFVFRSGGSKITAGSYQTALEMTSAGGIGDSYAGLSLFKVGVQPDITFSINDLRTAFQMQRFYETLARSGTRFNEFIKGVFGVDTLDATIQRPQYLCSQRFTINMSQVIQTSSTDNTSPQGNTSGISATLCNNDNCFNRSFTEPGILMGLVVVRTNQTYNNRLPKEFSKKRKFDYYYPVFAHLGEQAILNKEIYYSGNSEVDNLVFGYQEAWYEYRYKPSYVSGLFNNDSSSSDYAPWTYTSYFTDTPVLNKNFIQETSVNVDRTLAVQGGAQFIVDFYCEPIMTRLMPLHSIPGLIDHF